MRPSPPPTALANVVQATSGHSEPALGDPVRPLDDIHVGGSVEDGGLPAHRRGSGGGGSSESVRFDVGRLVGWVPGGSEVDWSTLLLLHVGLAGDR